MTILFFYASKLGSIKGLFAQLVWIRDIARNELDYMEDDALKFTWVPVFTTALPSPAAFEQIELLSPEEVQKITSFFYS